MNNRERLQRVFKHQSIRIVQTVSQLHFSISRVEKQIKKHSYIFSNTLLDMKKIY